MQPVHTSTGKTFVLPSVLFFIVICAACSQMSEEQLVAKARDIHARVLTIDTHDDIPFDFATAEVDPGLRDDRQVNIPKMQEGGLDAGFFIVYVGQTARTPENYEKAKADAMTKFNAIHRMAKEMHPDKIELAFAAADVERIHQSGKLVACIGIENGYVIGKDLSLLKKYHELGARYITLAHNGHNDICDSANPQKDFGDAEAEHNGVGEFGRQVIAEMNRLGIMLDVSHVSKQAMLQAAKLSKAPVIASHSSARALCDVPRNMDEEQLLALKENGGVIQITAVSNFIKKAAPEKQEAEQKLREEMGLTSPASFEQLAKEQEQEYNRRRKELDKTWPRATVKEFVDHVDHCVKLVGVDHVGISSDFDGGGGIEGWDDASETFNVTLEMVRRGYSEEEIAKIWSGNLLRVWREVERVASTEIASANKVTQ